MLAVDERIDTKKENENGDAGRPNRRGITGFLGPNSLPKEPGSEEGNRETSVTESGGRGGIDETDVRTTDTKTAPGSDRPPATINEGINGSAPSADRRRYDDVQNTEDSTRDSGGNGQNRTGDKVYPSRSAGAESIDNPLQNRILTDLKRMSDAQADTNSQTDDDFALLDNDGITTTPKESYTETPNPNGVVNIKRISVVGKAPVTPSSTIIPFKGKTKVDEKDVHTDFVSSAPLNKSEQEVFLVALIEISKYFDEGLWYVGIDTLSDVPTMDLQPGVPIWELDENEAQVVMDTLMRLGAKRPMIYKQMRVVNNLYNYLQVGLIGASRLWNTGTRLFMSGINMRFSKDAYIKSVDEFNRAAGTK